MNRIIQICTAALAIGAVLFIGGAAAGGRLYGRIENGRVLPSFGRAPAMEGHGSTRPTPGLPDLPDLPDFPDLPDLPDLPDISPITSLHKLDFELGAGDYTIVAGNGFSLDYNGNWIDSNIEDGVWRIRSHFTWSNLFDRSDRQCTITVPAECTFEKIDWDIGAANVKVLTRLTADKAEFDVGAGNLEISGLDVRDKLTFDVGAGNVEAALAGSWSDYQIRADVAMGLISINGSDLVSGLSSSCTKGDGQRKIDADLGMGNIFFTTEEA